MPRGWESRKQRAWGPAGEGTMSLRLPPRPLRARFLSRLTRGKTDGNLAAELGPLQRFGRSRLAEKRAQS
eukprot:scaffold2231_cov106-Isochrysis_galbana.AAC.8